MTYSLPAALKIDYESKQYNITQGSQLQIPVRYIQINDEFGTPFNKDQFKQLWISGEKKPVNMYVDLELMKIIWNVPRDSIPEIYELEIYAEGHDGLGISKYELIIDVKTGSELEIDVLIPRLEDRICWFILEKIDCEMDLVKGNLYLVFGEKVDNYEIEYEIRDSVLKTEFSIRDKLLVWNRSDYTAAQLLDESPEIVLTFKLTEGDGYLTINSEPFTIIPLWEPIISDLSPISPQSACSIAYIGLYFTCSFVITRGPDVYPDHKDNFIEQDITVSISDPQTIQRNDNLLTFYPISNSSPASITISYTLNQQTSRIFSKSYEITFSEQFSYTPCTEFGTESNPDRMIYILRLNSINLNDCNIYTDCKQSNSEDILSYSLVGNYPTTMELENNILKWTPDRSELGVYRDIQVSIEIEDKGKLKDLVLSLRPKSYLEVELSDLNPLYGERFVSCLKLVDENSSISIQDLEATLDDKDVDLELMENVCIVWNPVNMNEVDITTFTRSIQLTIKDSPNLKGWLSQTITPTFTFNLQINHLIPTFTNFPLSDTDNKPKEGELWSKEVKCSISIEGISFTYSISDQPSMTLNDQNEIEFTPGYQSCSNTTSISCTSSNSDIQSSSYSFVLDDIETLARTPSLECEELVVTEQSDIEQYQLPLNNLFSEVQDVSVTIESSQLALYEGLHIYKLGFLVWNSQIFRSKTAIQDNLLIHLNIKDKSYHFNLPFRLNPYDDLPVVSPLSPIILDRILLATSKTFQVSASDEENTNLEYISQTSNLANSGLSSNQFTWSPSSSDTYTDLSIVVSDGVHEVEALTMGCQGLKCRQYPVLERIITTSRNCLQIQDDNIDPFHGLTDCEVRYYHDQIQIEIYGKNLKIITDSSGNYQFNYEVFIGRKKCRSITILNSESVSCILPLPTSSFDTYRVYLKEISGSLVSYPNLQVSYSSYPGPELIPGDLFASSQNFLTTPDDSEEHKVVLYGTGFLPECSCKFEDIAGEFEYLSEELAYCIIKDEKLKDRDRYKMKIECGGLESSSEDYIVTASSFQAVTLSGITSGHSYGGYKIQMNIVDDIAQEDCENPKLMLELDNHYFNIRHTCKTDNNLDFYIRSPQFDDTATTREIYYSLNRGLSWSILNPLSFSYTGFCSLGYYTDSNICSICPEGSYCNNSNSDLDYLQSPRPCDLGYYQNSTGSTSCKICQEGYQCFCKGMEDSVICDAGFICDQEGIVKRWKPCPSGHYCPKGTQTKFTQSVIEVRWYGYCQGYEQYGMCDGDMNYCMNPKIWGWCGYETVRVCYSYCYYTYSYDWNCDLGWWNWWMWWSCYTYELICYEYCFDELIYYQDFCEAPLMIGSCNQYDPSWYTYVNWYEVWPWYYGWCQDAYQSPSYSAKLLRKIGNCRRFDTVQLATNMPQECPEGVYCVGGIYQLENVEGDHYTTEMCPEDLVCKKGSGNPYAPPDCSVGSFCPYQLTEENCNEDDDFIQFSPGCTCQSTKCPCSRGYYCDSAQLRKPLKCPSGTYSNQLGGISCSTCEPGKYCPYDTSKAPREMLSCPKGNSCRARAINPTVCDEGYYQSQEGKPSCEECIVGYYCPYKQMQDPTECPEGRVCSSKALIVPSNCPEGYFCTAGTNSTHGFTEEEYLKPEYSLVTALSSGRPIPCKPGEACPLNSPSAQICVLGSYTLTWLSSICLLCPKGKLCPNNNVEPVECPAGSWCSDNQEFGCPEGYYCVASTTTTNYLPQPNDTPHELRPIPCRPGTYCIGRNTHWDPYDSTTRNPAKACSPGTYNDQYAQVECKECPAGFRCTVSECTIPIQCQPGTWSPKKSVNCQLCPQGTYNPNTGSTSIHDCIQCPAGLVCEADGLGSYIESSSKCPAGFYCPEGTNVASRQDNPCPIGTFCYEGTKSLNEALRNKCPAGRFCDSGTGADNEEAYEQCLQDPNKCDIGAPCNINFYCELGTQKPLACPEGTVSYGGAISISYCIRDHTKFYESKITHTEQILESSISPLTFTSFELEFVNMYEKATIPEDLQMVIEIFDVNDSRYLATDTTRILLFSDTQYGTQYSVPVIYPQINILNKKLNVKLNLFTNMSLKISLVIEYLKGKVDWDSEITERSKVQLTTSSVFSRSFLCVINRDIGALFEDPINIYRIYSLDSSSRLKSSEMSIMNDILLSIDVESDSSNSNSFYPKRLWDDLPSGVDEYYTTYLPYITDCISGYGAFLPISALMSDSRCTKVTEPTPVTLSGFFDEVQATSCNFELICDFSLDLDVIDRRKRWYETITDSNNSGISYKDELPPFYISRRSIESSDIASYTSQSKEYQDTLIPVRVTRDSDSSWQTGYVPDKVELQLGYYQKNTQEFEVITADLVLSNFRDKKDRDDNGLYSFGVNIRPLNWTECFDNNAFTKEEYSKSTLAIASGLASLIGVTVISALIFRPYRYKPVFVRCVVSQFVRSIQGLILVLLPTVFVGYIMWMLLNEGKMFAYDTGNFDDKSVVKDLNSDDAMRYRAGRFGTCLCVIGLLIIKWSVKLLIPMKEKESYDYKQVSNTYKEELDNNRSSGALIAIIVISMLYILILSSFGDYDLFTRMPYIFILITAFANFLLYLFCIKALKSEMQAIVIELILKFGVFSMILSCKRLTLILFCFWILYSMRILYESYFLTLFNRFLNNIFLKKNERFLTLNSQLSTRQEKCYTNLKEMGKKSQGYILTWLISFYSLFLWHFYPYLNLSMPRDNYLYVTYLTAYLVFLELFIQFGVFWVRQARDKNFRIPSILKSAYEEYTARSATWAVSSSKVRYELELSSQVVDLYGCAFSSQYYFVMFLTSAGVLSLFCGVKMFLHCNYSPFMDYNLFFLVVITACITIAIKNVSLRIGKKAIWRPRNAVKVENRSAFGQFIMNMNHMMIGKLGKKEMENNPDFDNTNIVEVANQITSSLDNVKNTEDQLSHIVSVLKQRQISKMVSYDKIFQTMNTTKGRVDAQGLQDKIEKTQIPEIKILYVEALRTKNRLKCGHFPQELVYPW